jgi:hypothetical protein
VVIDAFDLEEYLVDQSSIVKTFAMQALGAFEFRHVNSNLLRGYRSIDLGGGQKAFVATPEKALLDLIHLHPGADSPNYLRELRLQNLERLNLEEMGKMASSIGSAKLQRAVNFVVELGTTEVREYETL